MQMKVALLMALTAGLPLSLQDKGCCTPQVWFIDQDGDGYGSDSDVVESCEQPPGYVAEAGDCDDLDAAVNPGMGEVCDGLDNDCDGEVDEDCPTTVDRDGDGWPAEKDCDDADPTVYPGAREVCDRQDNDCDGVVDEGCSGGTDNDGDGWAGVESGGKDCNDWDATVYPGAPEACDRKDNDCDGSVDEGCGGIDDDGDGYASLDSGGTDCNDRDPAINPGAEEVCDALDNDCDGELDEGCNAGAEALCAETGGRWTDCGSGCGPATCENPNPGSDGCPDVCVAQCVCPSDAPLWDPEKGCIPKELCEGEVDRDGDGYPSGKDCDDTDPAVNPGAREVCDKVDNDCDGVVDEGCLIPMDRDGDGYMAPEAGGGDCDDADASVYPGAAEGCDGKDNDCDGAVDETCETQRLCAATGGSWELGCEPKSCANPDGDQTACVQAEWICVCPEEAPYWDDVEGCVTWDGCWTD